MRRLFAPVALIALALVLAGYSAAWTTSGDQGGITYAIIGDTPYGASPVRGLSAARLRRQRRSGRRAHASSRRHQGRRVALFRRVLRPDARQLRLVPGSARRDAGRQRVDRLPPPGRGWIHPDGAARAVPFGLLSARLQEPRRSAQVAEDPGRHARLRDLRREQAVDGTQGRLRDGARGRLEQRPRAVVRRGRDASAAGRASRRVRRPPRRDPRMAGPHLRVRGRGGRAWCCHRDAGETCGSTRRSASRRSSSGSPTAPARSASRCCFSKATRTASPSTVRSRRAARSTASPRRRRTSLASSLRVETIGEWLKLRIDPKAAELFTWTRMPVL